MPPEEHWIEKGLFALFICFVALGPQYAGVTGIGWLQLSILGAGITAVFLVRNRVAPDAGLRKQAFIILGIWVGLAGWDVVVLRAKGQTGIAPSQASPVQGASPPAEPRYKAPFTQPTPKQKIGSITGHWRGKVICGARFDNLRWTISTEPDGIKVVEFYYTGRFGISNTKPIIYTGRWRGETLHLVADKDHASYEIDLVESDDGQSMKGHYALHGNCDDVSLQREEE